MTDKFYPISLKQLLQIILNELNTNDSIFGIPSELFYKPNTKYQQNIFDQNIDSPLGVAAGPHSQMAQNIIAAWLMGSRYIELKTIQTLDELEIAKPCIDMQDEGYNCEWSQELKIEESFHEYLNAWIAIHILNHKFGFSKDIGTIFNMSVGYNLEGILKDNVQWFFEKMNNCEAELKDKTNEIKSIYPAVAEISIPSQISNNITLSTMHGCPANEIEDIARYLLEKKNLHTYVKLNPTLLGPEKLREILNTTCKFKTQVPDEAFEHDLKYKDALNIIKSLQETAKENNLEFGLKLTNTLESENNKKVFENDVEMMYMSGRALHPLSINLASILQNEFEGELNLSFSAGVDAFNVSDVLSCGFKTITVCSDLLKPGGYMRLNQYFGEMEKNFDNSTNISGFIEKIAAKNNNKEALLNNLGNYANTVLESDRYKREFIHEPNIKTGRNLDYFDCISAPCKDTCSTNQDIPNYMFHSANNQFDKAYETILKTNPFPSITGMVCDHLCQNKCTRVNYDNSLLIREVKRYISEQEEVKLNASAKNNLKVAIIGAGPSGLSAAYYLALAGFEVEVFEGNSKAGGMVQFAIPGFRLTDKAIEKDFKRVTDLGVKINYDHKIDGEKFQDIRSNYNYIFIGTGAQLSTPLNIDGINAQGVIEPLEFLFNVKKEKETGLGNNVAIIGGGNTAMDAARTAYRLVGKEGKVTIVYRRTINEMPADQGEIKAVLEEGMAIFELASPEKVIVENGQVKALLCSKMELKEADASGRPKPVKIEGSEFEIPCDTIIPAIGQKLDIDFIPNDLLQSNTTTYKTKLKNIYIGGDALRGASTAINAIGDGRKAAEQIIKQAEIDYSVQKTSNDKKLGKKELVLKRAKRTFAPELKELALSERKSFKLVSETLSKDEIVAEAKRCLYCDEICNICATVCPNFANYSYDVDPLSYDLQKAVKGDDGQMQIIEDQKLEIKQSHQILNIANFCNECGNCNTFCPTNSAPFKEKPKFYLTIQSFNKAKEGYCLVKLPDRTNLIYKDGDHIVTLSEYEQEYVYETSHVVAKFTKEGFRIKDVNFLTPCAKQMRFKDAAEMTVLLKAAEGLIA